MTNQVIALKEKIAAVQFKKEKKYWLEKFSCDLLPGKIPYDYNHDNVDIRSFDGPRFDDLRFTFPGDLFSNLVRLSSGSDYKLHMILVAGLITLLKKYTGNSDIVIGTSIYNQEVEAEFVNTVLPLKNNIEDNMTFKELLLQVRQCMIEAVENQNYPLETLMFQLNMPFDDNHFPLFDIAILLENIQDKKYVRHINTKMLFSFLRTNEGIEGVLEYNSSLYKKGTIQRVVDHYTHLLGKALSNLDLKVSRLDILPDEERKQLLFQFNNTDKEYPGNKTINGLFEEEVEIVPDHSAVVFEGIHLSYKELNTRSNQLARVLRLKGVKTDTIIGLMVEPGLEMVIGMLAILKAGGAYLAMDLEFPEGRKKYMIAEGNVKLLLLQHDMTSRENGSPGQFFPGKILFIDEKNTYSSDASNLEIVNNPGNLTYVMFTSGSTGRPKGVMVDHSNVVNLLYWFGQKYNLHPGVHVLGLTDYTFDPSVEDVFGTFIHGATLYLVDNNLFITPMEFRNYVDKYQINIFDYVPAALKELLGEGDKLKSLEVIISGGERLEDRLKDQIIEKGYKLYNNYGPTEVTVDVLSARCSEKKVTLGRPIFNMRCYVLDANNNLLPIGMYGELCILGAGLARGYLNRPEVTAERFVAGPFSAFAGERMYRTGDICRWTGDGEVEFLGRKDHQVKIRGFRIELGEIELLLSKYKKIRDVVVIANEGKNEDRYLCAYVVSDEEFSVSELRDYLSGNLPYYMVPQFIVKLEHIPLTSSGKVDRKSLPEPGLEIVGEFTAPSDEVERKLAEIWSEVLGIEKDKIGMDSDFFELGGHSLKATSVLAKVHKRLNAKALFGEVFKRTTIREFSQYISSLEEEKYVSIASEEKKEWYIVSSAQKRLYILQEMDLDGIDYNVPDVVIMEGALNREALGNTFRELIHRHESLRTSFHMTAGELVQRIHKDFNFKIEYYDASQVGAEVKVEEEEQKTGDRGQTTGSKPANLSTVIRHLSSEFIRPFDLSQAPLLRVGLIRLHTPPFGHPSQEGNAEDKHILMIDMHHIITDGISMELFVRESMALYAGEALPQLKFQYKDYARWQNSDRRKEAIEEQEKYWLRQFADEVPVLNLPIDYPRPVIQSSEGNVLAFESSVESTRELKQLAQDTGTTLYMLLLAIYDVLLSKISAQEDIAVGTPVSGRHHADQEQIIGMFVNTLVMRNYPTANKEFINFLSELKERTLEAFENQEYQFEDLVEKKLPNRDASRNPLFDTMFTLENMDVPIAGNSQLRIRPYDIELLRSMFDISLTCFEAVGKLHCSFEYCTKLFKKDTIERFILYFNQILSTVLENPRQKISQIEIITAEEKQQVLYDFNDTAAAYPGEKTLHRLFEEQVERTPDRTAIVVPSVSVEAIHEAPLQITYRELNEKSIPLAHLLKERGVQPDIIVGIMVERSIQMITAIWAVLKAGGGYLPIDPEYPRDRIDYMLKDSNVGILLTTPKLQVKAGVEENTRQLRLLPLRLINIESEPAPSFETLSLTSTYRVSPTNLAYILYTSGSTGKPKGVMVEHRNVVAYISAYYKIVGINSHDVIIQQSSYSFDVFVEEVYPAILKGARIAIPKKHQVMDVYLLKDFIIKNNVTIIGCSPLLLDQLNELEGSIRLPIRKFLGGGDVLRKEYIDKLLKVGEVYNGYGPTESTVCITFYKCPRELKANIPIGKPISNYKVYILDKHNHLQPVGIPGELCVAGGGVARGYLNQPQLTVERFEEVSNPCLKNKRLYRTGDQARWQPDGNIEFLGRIDRQVQIRGFRIELEEIENQLLTLHDINDAVVIEKTGEDGDKYLCAYIVSNIDITGKELRAFLSGRLPGYMIPSFYMKVERIPLTHNGKVDKKALPELKIKPAREDAYIGPRDEIEKKLVEIWQQVLNRDGGPTIGVEDNFFELGGHSLKATILMSGINRIFNVRVPVIEIFKTPTIRHLAEYIKEAKGVITSIKTTDDQIVLLKKKSDQANHFFFIHDGSGQVDGYIEFCNHLPGEFNCWGIQGNRLEHLAPQQWTIKQLSKEYVEKVKKVQPHGPYFIGGWSLGGTIAFEMANQLEQDKEPVAFLALIDSPGPQGDLIDQVRGFTLESELAFIRNYLPDKKITQRIGNVTEMNQAWPIVVDYLENDNSDFESIKKIILEQGVHEIPNVDELNIQETVYYLNLIRTFDYARALYIPDRKVDVEVHYFSARKTVENLSEQWKPYCHKPLEIYKVDGDHFSIFKPPDVVEFSKIFAKVMDEIKVLY